MKEQIISYKDDMGAEFSNKKDLNRSDCRVLDHKRQLVVCSISIEKNAKGEVLSICTYYLGGQHEWIPVKYRKVIALATIHLIENYGIE